MPQEEKTDAIRSSADFATSFTKSSGGAIGRISRGEDDALKRSGGRERRREFLRTKPRK
jgi:hypothetical protein